MKKQNNINPLFAQIVQAHFAVVVQGKKEVKKEVNENTNKKIRNAKS